MRIFKQEQNPSRRGSSLNLPISNMAVPGTSHDPHPILNLQRTIGNQAVQRLRQAPPQGLGGGSVTPLAVNAPGDRYEREADRVADQVLQMPDLRLQDGPLQTERAQANNAGETVAPPIVSEGLRSQALPLDSATIEYFESHLGHDLSGVRVHTGTAAAAAANAINAKAFTAGNEIVFGAGQYSPASSEGRRLLAHELTHVVQQATPSAGNDLIQRSPEKPSVVEQRREQRFEKMAKWPDEAHRAWKKLNEVDRFILLWQIASRYGEDFARDFLKAAAGGMPRGTYDEYYGRGVGPKPERLVAKGFRLAQKDSVHEWWVHSSGKIVTRNFSVDNPVQPPSQTPEEDPQIEIEGTEGWPTRLDPNADREELFGPIVSERENADIGFGEGDAVRYEDGTIELFLQGTTKSYVFRPLPGGGYIAYGPDGQKLDSILVIPPEDIP